MASLSLTGRFRTEPAVPTLALGAGAIGLYFLLPPHGQSVFYVVIGAAAVGGIYLGAVRNLPSAERLPWLLFAAGLLCQVAGDTIFAVYELHLDREPPSPSVADAFYLGGYPLLALGIFLVLKRIGAQVSRAAVLDTLVVFCGVALFQWVFFIEPYRHQEFANESQRLVAMAYPAMDVLLAVGLAQLLLGPGGRTRAYRLLLVSIALWVVADEIYGLNVDTYQGGDWIDALWLGSYVVWAAAALDPSMARLAEPDRRRLPRLTAARIGLLAGGLLLGPAILVYEQVRHGTAPYYVIAALSAVIGVLVLFRLSGLVRAVERAGRAERDARQQAERAQQLLTFQNQKLVEIDNLKDEFVSSVSHELRTPLTSISGYVEVLLEGEDDEERRDYLSIVDRNAQRLLGLVSDLLFAARLQGGRLELERTAVDFAEIVAHSVASARPRAETAAVEITIYESRVPKVIGQADRLAQLLDNLVSNAIKFTPPGGRIDVRLATLDGHVRLEVSDTGIGIPEPEREKLFERFFRSQTALERQIQGTGLGLYISKAIVEAHGGRIGVQSAEGRGTTFVVELPIAR
ncbi:MAG TPA: HAMP domain-containing sensor histidine kinase [Gaiellaceae bacterium]|nr:HAMP domain-containing sensor histidine kinase [Gaiellaceae bacterium]